MVSFNVIAGWVSLDIFNQAILLILCNDVEFELSNDCTGESTTEVSDIDDVVSIISDTEYTASSGE